MDDMDNGILVIQVVEVEVDGEFICCKLDLVIVQLLFKQKVVFSMWYFEEKSYQEMVVIFIILVGVLKVSYYYVVKKIEFYLSEG